MRRFVKGGRETRRWGREGWAGNEFARGKVGAVGWVGEEGGLGGGGWRGGKGRRVLGGRWWAAVWELGGEVVEIGIGC